MSTTAQIKANRQNAQKSTGPKTDQGKAVVAKNAVKHGLFAAEVVITGENPAEYQAFHDEFLAELAPAGMAESVMAERIISLAWRLRRAERMQNQAIDVMLAIMETNAWHKMQREDAAGAQDPRAGGLELLLGWAAKNDFLNNRVLGRMLLYERRIENSMMKMMNELKKFQMIRQAELKEVQKRKAIPKASGFEAATRQVLTTKNSDVKKQTQFAPAVMGATTFEKGGYSNIPADRTEENKANQSQLPAGVVGLGG
jgi:hypothetical protein